MPYPRSSFRFRFSLFLLILLVYFVMFYFSREDFKVSPMNNWNYPFSSFIEFFHFMELIWGCHILVVLSTVTTADLFHGRCVPWLVIFVTCSVVLVKLLIGMRLSFFFGCELCNRCNFNIHKLKRCSSTREGYIKNIQEV